MRAAHMMADRSSGRDRSHVFVAAQQARLRADFHFEQFQFALPAPRNQIMLPRPARTGGVGPSLLSSIPSSTKCRRK
jgi:hypothetical protein